MTIHHLPLRYQKATSERFEKKRPRSSVLFSSGLTGDGRAQHLQCRQSSQMRSHQVSESRLSLSHKVIKSHKVRKTTAQTQGQRTSKKPTVSPKSRISSQCYKTDDCSTEDSKFSNANLFVSAQTLTRQKQRIKKIAKGGWGQEGATSRTAPYGRHQSDFWEGHFVVGGHLRVLSIYIFLVNTWRDFSGGIFVFGWCLRAPKGAQLHFGPFFQLHFSCKHIRDWRVPSNRKGRQGGMTQLPPPLPTLLPEKLLVLYLQCQPTDKAKATSCEQTQHDSEPGAIQQLDHYTQTYCVSIRYNTTMYKYIFKHCL